MEMQIRSKGVENWSRDLILKFWDPLHISAKVRARNVEFGMQMHRQRC